jgi:hypothetical protein
MWWPRACLEIRSLALPSAPPVRGTVLWRTHLGSSPSNDFVVAAIDSRPQATIAYRGGQYFLVAEKTNTALAANVVCRWAGVEVRLKPLPLFRVPRFWLMAGAVLLLTLLVLAKAKGPTPRSAPASAAESEQEQSTAGTVDFHELVSAGMGQAKE